MDPLEYRMLIHNYVQGCIQKFRQGRANLGYRQKRWGTPGGSSVVSCEVLHSRGGGGGGRE